MFRLLIKESCKKIINFSFPMESTISEKWFSFVWLIRKNKNENMVEKKKIILCFYCIGKGKVEEKVCSFSYNCCYNSEESTEMVRIGGKVSKVIIAQ